MISFIQTIFGDIGFDAVLSEAEHVSANVTKHPVEFGANITDHVYVEPAEVVIRGAVSNNVFKDRINPLSPFEASFSDDVSRVQNAWGALLEIQAAGEPFSVQTGFKLWENMVIEDLRTERDARTANVLMFVASLREIFVVDSKATALPPRKLSEPKKASAVQRGKVQTQATSLALSLLRIPAPGLLE